MLTYYFLDFHVTRPRSSLVPLLPGLWQNRARPRVCAGAFTREPEDVDPLPPFGHLEVGLVRVQGPTREPKGRYLKSRPEPKGRRLNSLPNPGPSLKVAV